jgi:hypothetical protein
MGAESAGAAIFLDYQPTESSRRTESETVWRCALFRNTDAGPGWLCLRVGQPGVLLLRRLCPRRGSGSAAITAKTPKIGLRRECALSPVGAPSRIATVGSLHAPEPRARDCLEQRQVSLGSRSAHSLGGPRTRQLSSWGTGSPRLSLLAIARSPTWWDCHIKLQCDGLDPAASCL